MSAINNINNNITENNSYNSYNSYDYTDLKDFKDFIDIFPDINSIIDDLPLMNVYPDTIIKQVNILKSNLDISWHIPLDNLLDINSFNHIILKRLDIYDEQLFINISLLLLIRWITGVLLIDININTIDINCVINSLRNIIPNDHKVNNKAIITLSNLPLTCLKCSDITGLSSEYSIDECICNNCINSSINPINRV